MIFQPKVGQHVRVHYARQAATLMPHHGSCGIVRVVAHGRGPRNAGVELDGGRLVVVPRGNLVALPEKTRSPFPGAAGLSDQRGKQC